MLRMLTKPIGAFSQIMHGCYLATHMPDAETGRRFTPDVLMANPPSFAHIHLAEALGRGSRLFFHAHLLPCRPDQGSLNPCSPPSFDFLHALESDNRFHAPSRPDQVIQRQKGSAPPPPPLYDASAVFHPDLLLFRLRPDQLSELRDR